MNISLYIARRLGLRSAETHGASPGVAVGYVGVTLAVAIMLLSIFVVSGFKSEINAKLLGINANITIYAPAGDDTPAITSGMQLSDTLRTLITRCAPEAEPSLIIRQPAIFKTPSDFQGIVLKGIEPRAAEWQFFADNMTAGAVPADTAGANVVVISENTARKLGVGVGDKIDTHFLAGDNLRTRRLMVTGIFATHFHDFDDTFALTSIEMLQQLNRVDSLTGTAVEIRNLPLDQSQAVARLLMDEMIHHSALHPDRPMIYDVATIADTGAQYLNWLDLLDTNVAVIIVLMAFVAGFTLISSLFIIILERVGMIGLLKALGATNGQVRRIFIYMAMRLVITGVAIGTLLAIAIALIQSRYHLMPLSPESYYLSFVPMQINWLHVALVDVTALVVAALVLILPSQLVASMSPASTLRYE